ncbi:MAG: hypothetical protein OEZ11_02535 [Gammaproteobacteria bacterium]|nr:hypothetical protein [Gammaproteobacteria bacterium]
MLETSSAICNRKFRRRAPALLGILALALMQVSIASHQFEHTADHGFSVCQVCATYNQLDNALIPDALPGTFPIGLHVAASTTARPFEAAPTSAPYESRASPNS